MGTLTDITVEINNGITRQSNASTTLQALNSAKKADSLAKRKSPNFMSPTLSSTQQNVANVSKAQNRYSTPPSATSKLQGSGWMASAAKRVGFKRVGDGTPRSRKESLSPKGAAFPDKVCAFSP